MRRRLSLVDVVDRTRFRRESQCPVCVPTAVRVHRRRDRRPVVLGQVRRTAAAQADLRGCRCMPGWLSGCDDRLGERPECAPQLAAVKSGRRSAPRPTRFSRTRAPDPPPAAVKVEAAAVAGTGRIRMPRGPGRTGQRRVRPSALKKNRGSTKRKGWGGAGCRVCDGAVTRAGLVGTRPVRARVRAPPQMSERVPCLGNRQPPDDHERRSKS